MLLNPIVVAGQIAGYCCFLLSTQVIEGMAWEDVVSGSLTSQSILTP